MSKCYLVKECPGIIMITVVALGIGDKHKEAKEKLETGVINGIKNFPPKLIEKDLMKMMRGKEPKNISQLTCKLIAKIKKEHNLNSGNIQVRSIAEIDIKPVMH